MASSVQPHSVPPSGSGGAATSSGNGGGSAGGAAQPQASGGAGSNLLWAKTQQLPEEAFRQLHSIYGDHFPLEARHHLAGEAASSFPPF